MPPTGSHDEESVGRQTRCPECSRGQQGGVGKREPVRQSGRLYRGSGRLDVETDKVMETYTATFASHYGAVHFKRTLEEKGYSAYLRPVPRSFPLPAVRASSIRFLRGTPS